MAQSLLEIVVMVLLLAVKIHVIFSLLQTVLVSHRSLVVFITPQVLQTQGFLTSVNQQFLRVLKGFSHHGLQVTLMVMVLMMVYLLTEMVTVSVMLTFKTLYMLSNSLITTKAVITEAKMNAYH